jgi:hypothetical protein
MAKLTAAARRAIPTKSFALPGSRRYPIEDESHAKNALARASGKPEESTVRAAVHHKYPGIGADKKKHSENRRLLRSVHGAV